MSNQTNTTYTVVQDFGTFKLFEPGPNGAFVQHVRLPDEVGESSDEERAWFTAWCDQNSITPVFEN